MAAAEDASMAGGRRGGCGGGAVGGGQEEAGRKFPSRAWEDVECGLGGVFPPNPHFYRLETSLRVGLLIFFTGLRV